MGDAETQWHELGTSDAAGFGDVRVYADCAAFSDNSTKFRIIAREDQFEPPLDIIITGPAEFQSFVQALRRAEREMSRRVRANWQATLAMRGGKKRKAMEAANAGSDSR